MDLQSCLQGRPLPRGTAHCMSPTRSPLLRVSGQDTFLDRGLLGGAARPSLVLESAGIVESGVRKRWAETRQEWGKSALKNRRWVTPRLQPGRG